MSYKEEDTCLPYGETAMQAILGVEGGQQLHLDPVVDGVDHRRLGENGSALLLHARRLKARFKHVE